MAFSIIICFILTVVTFKHFFWKPQPWPKNALQVPLLQSHRGYWVEGARENTMPAFEAAKNNGFTMTELDVQISMDGVPVVFHDRTLTRIAGLDKAAQDCTSAELKKIADIPTLEEVLQSKNVPRHFNIELKTSAIFKDVVESKVGFLIKKYNAEDRVLISSFNPLALRRISKVIPNVPRALLASYERVDENKVYLRRLWFAPYIKIHALHLDYKYVTIEELRYWQKRKVPVALWTVNDSEQAKTFLQHGAFSIITDAIKPPLQKV